MKNRISKDEYFMEIADVVAKRATCPRRSVGSVLVVDDHIIATGYNGAPRGLEHCSEAGCDMSGGHCIRAVHSEQNVLCQANILGISTKNSTLYTTTIPCPRCMGLIINCEIKKIVYKSLYKNCSHLTDGTAKTISMATQSNIEMVKFVK